MISFSKCTAEQYAGLTPVTDRIYYITDTGEIYLNGVKYGSGEITQIQADWDQSDSTAADYIKDKPVLAPVATLGTYNSLAGKPAIPNFTGDWFGIWHDMTDSAATTVTLSVSGTNARANTFQYCTNISTNVWQDYTLGTALTLTQYQYVLWRNKDAAKLLGNNTGRYVFSITGGGVYLAGNLMTLKDKGGQYNSTAAAYDFYEMFKDCTAIKDASMLSIPAAVMSNYSCYGMFNGCTGMVRGPAILPATVLGAQCYRFMFNSCTSLVKAPELPATTLASMCYHCMFGGCTSLTEAPDLPAETVPSKAYNFMFQGCTSLRHVRTAATALGTDNSQSWLYGVASAGVIECHASLDLSTRGADTAPAGWKVVRTDQPQADWDQSDSTEASYIRNKPAVPAPGEQVQSDWDESDSASPAYILNKEDVDDTVDGVDAFAGSLEAYFADPEKQPLTITIADPAGSNSISIYRTHPEGTLVYDYEYSRDGETWTAFTWEDGAYRSNLVAIGSGADSDAIMIRGHNPFGTYNSCINTSSQAAGDSVKVSGNLYSLLVKYGWWMIDDLELYGSDQPYTPGGTNFNSIFFGLFYNYPSYREYYDFNCTDASGLILPADRLCTGCYYYLLSGTAITKAPVLPATHLASASYLGTFYRCPSLSDVTVGFTEWPSNPTDVTSPTRNWLMGVASTGVFRCPAALDTTIARGTSTIPANWTIETY